MSLVDSGLRQLKQKTKNKEQKMINHTQYQNSKMTHPERLISNSFKPF
jgi:hypothetical protein